MNDFLKNIIRIVKGLMKLKRIYFYLNNIFWLVAIYLLAPFFYLCIFFKKGQKKRDKKKILVIPPVKIGDLICSTPVFREIKKNIPKSHLEVLLLTSGDRNVTAFQLLKYNPYIDKIILPDPKKGIGILGIFWLIKKVYHQNYNWSFALGLGTMDRIIPFCAGIYHRVIAVSEYARKSSKLLNFLGVYKSEIKLHDLALRHHLKLLKFIGVKNPQEKKEVFVSSRDKEKAKDFLSKNNLSEKDFLVGIAVTAGNKLKEWPPDKFVVLADRLVKELSAKIIFVGGPGDDKIISSVQSKMNQQSVSASNQLNLLETAALMKYLRLFVSVDTGPLYLANTMEVPIVDIVGPFDIKTQMPEDEIFEVVENKIPCFPCSFVIKTAHFCKLGHKKCIKDINVDDVYNGVIRIIEKYSI